MTMMYIPTRTRAYPESALYPRHERNVGGISLVYYLLVLLSTWVPGR